MYNSRLPLLLLALTLPLLSLITPGQALAIRADVDFGDTFATITAGPGVHLKGWPEQPGPNPTYDAEWQTSRKFAMPSNRNGLALPTIQHEGGRWEVVVETTEGGIKAYCEVRATIVDAGADHSFDFTIADDGLELELNRCGCWAGLTMTCTSGAIGPGGTDLKCGAVHGPCE